MKHFEDAIICLRGRRKTLEYMRDDKRYKKDWRGLTRKISQFKSAEKVLLKYEETK